MGRLFLILSAIFPAAALGGCSSLFFYPDRDYVTTPEKIGLPYEEVTIPSGEYQLHCWLLRVRSGKASIVPKGTVVHLHGNAENISTHINSTYWLPEEGYNVLLVDYRGYGGSSGEPSIEGLREDALAAIRYVTDRADLQGPVFVFGQSLGGAAAVAALHDFPAKDRISGLILESSFSGYRRIARDKLAAASVACPISCVVTRLVEDDTSPSKLISSVSPIPIFIAHGAADRTVPVAHARELIAAARDPKVFWITKDGGHINVLNTPEGRGMLLRFMADPVGSCARAKKSAP